MEWEKAALAPSHSFAKFSFPCPGKQTLVRANPQFIVFQIYRFNLIRCHQIGPVCADEAVSQSILQFIETS